MGSISLHNTLISLSFVLLFVFLSALFFSSFCILWPGICNFLLPNSINDKMRAQQQQSNNKKPQPEQEPATGALQVTGDCLSCCSPYWLLLFFFFFLSFPPFYLSVSVLCCHQHTKPHLAPLRRWGCLFSVLYTFHVMRKLNSFRYRTMITFGPVRPHHHPKMSSRNWCCSMCNERMERGVTLLGLPLPLPYSPITFFCLWFAYAVAKLVSSLFGSCHKFTKVFLYANPCSRTCFVLHLLLLLLLVAAGDGEAAVIESIDAFATRIS